MASLTSPKQAATAAKPSSEAPNHPELTVEEGSAEGSKKSEGGAENGERRLNDQLKNQRGSHGRSSDHLLIASQKDSMLLKDQIATSFMISPTLHKHRSRDSSLIQTGDMLMPQQSSVQYMDS